MGSLLTHAASSMRLLWIQKIQNLINLDVFNFGYKFIKPYHWKYLDTSAYPVTSISTYNVSPFYIKPFSLSYWGVNICWIDFFLIFLIGRSKITFEETFKFMLKFVKFAKKKIEETHRSTFPRKCYKKNVIHSRYEKSTIKDNKRPNSMKQQQQIFRYKWDK